MKNKFTTVLLSNSYKKNTQPLKQEFVCNVSCFCVEGKSYEYMYTILPRIQIQNLTQLMKTLYICDDDGYEHIL